MTLGETVVLLQGTATSVRERSQSRGSDEEEESGDESSQDSHRPDKLLVRKNYHFSSVVEN